MPEPNQVVFFVTIAPQPNKLISTHPWAPIIMKVRAHIAGDRQLHTIRSGSHAIYRAPNQLDWVTDQVKFWNGIFTTSWSLSGLHALFHISTYKNCRSSRTRGQSYVVCAHQALLMNLERWPTNSTTGPLVSSGTLNRMNRKIKIITTKIAELCATSCNRKEGVYDLNERKVNVFQDIAKSCLRLKQRPIASMRADTKI